MFVGRSRGIKVFFDQVGRTNDDCEQIAEIVCYSAGELAQGVQLFRLDQLCSEMFSFSFGSFQLRNVKSVGNAVSVIITADCTASQYRNSRTIFADEFFFVQGRKTALEECAIHRRVQVSEFRRRHSMKRNLSLTKFLP